MPDFNTWWADLPREMKRGNKPRAAMRYHTIEKNGELNALQEALLAYCRDQRENMWRKFMHGTTFLDRFREWLPDQERDRTELIEDERAETATLTNLHRHYCKGCASWP